MDDDQKGLSQERQRRKRTPTVHYIGNDLPKMLQNHHHAYKWKELREKGNQQQADRFKEDIKSLRDKELLDAQEKSTLKSPPIIS